jgi:hypothetical protein
MTWNILNTPEDCVNLSLGDSCLTFEKQHAYPGKFSMPTAGGRVDFELTEAAILQIADESQRYLDNGNQCNLPTHHTEDTEANRGKATKWYAKPDSKGRLGLFSVNEFRDEEAAKLAKTSQTSIFAPAETEDGAKNKYTRAVTHVALTGRPVIPGLDGFTPIAASLVSMKGKTMPMKDLAVSIGLQLSEDIASDDAKASVKIVEAFKVEQAAKDAAVLELSEYKKLNPPKTDPVRISKTQVAMLRENRELKLSNLVKDGNITPAVSKSLQDIFCGEATLSLALSEDKTDDFDAVVKSLKDNDPIKLSEQTGPQAGSVSTLLDPKTNPMLADAHKKVAAARRN